MSLDMHILVEDTSIYPVPKARNIDVILDSFIPLTNDILSINKSCQFQKKKYLLNLPTFLIFISVFEVQGTVFSHLICHYIFLAGPVYVVRLYRPLSTEQLEYFFFLDMITSSLFILLQSHLLYHHAVVHFLTEPFAMSSLSTFPTSLA